MAYKQKGFPMHSTSSALKHGDGTWGGSTEAPDELSDYEKAKKIYESKSPGKDDVFMTEDQWNTYDIPLEKRANYISGNYEL